MYLIVLKKLFHNIMQNLDPNHPLSFFMQNTVLVTFTFMHLADAFIQSDLRLQAGYTFSLSVHVFPGNRTDNLCDANAML